MKTKCDHMFDLKGDIHVCRKCFEMREFDPRTKTWVPVIKRKKER